MIFICLISLTLCTLSTSSSDEQSSSSSEKSDEYQIEVIETQSYENPELNSSLKLPIYWIVVVSIIGLIFIIIIAFSIRACCNRSNMKVESSTMPPNQNTGPDYLNHVNNINQQFYQQNFQRQAIIQQQQFMQQQQQMQFQQQQLFMQQYNS